MLFSSTTLVAAVVAAVWCSRAGTGVEALGCKGGDTFHGGGDGCNLNSVTCTQEACEEEMGGVWTEECPDPAPECDPLAPSADDPSCTGPPVAMDRFGKKLYPRKILATEKVFDDPGVGGVYTHITVELCPEESSLTQGIDAGFGDYYRLAVLPSWCTVRDWTPIPGVTYSQMYKCDGARSYSPVNPANVHNAQFIIKVATSGDGSCCECTPNVDCQFGFSEFIQYQKVGDSILMSAVPDHAGTEDSTHYVYKPNFDYEIPGKGPYTINFIGQGVALTELNVNAFSQLLNPLFPDGDFSNIQDINYLWANSYWNSSAWVFAPMGDNDDISRSFIRDGLQNGIRFNLMNSISREDVPQAEWPRTDVNVIGQAFNLTNTTNQDPNIKWFVVGSSGYKSSIYPQILEWGFDMYPCSDAAAKKGYPYCGPNALYEWEAPGAAGLKNRPRSMMWQYYESLPPVPTMDIPTTAEALGFTTLVAATKAANTIAFLSDPPNPGPLTVFAPSNEAFARLGDELLGCLLLPQYVLILQGILSYHVTYGEVLAGDLTNEQVIMMSDRRDILIEIDGGSVMINGKSKVERADIMATNGVIHAIDRVLVPPDTDVPAFLEACLATDAPRPTPPEKKKKKSKKNTPPPPP